ncbi:MAG TPA: MFS transporter [Chloroflexaceae bacterium]|nr:MFS transporter [Chloroflexaceae bacterium]
MSLFNAALEPAVLLYVPRELGVAPGLFGLIFAVGSAGALAGAAVSARLAPVVGPYRLLAGGLLIAALGDLLTPLATGSPLAIGLTLALGSVLFGVGVAVYRILAASLRQQLTPDALQGRVALSAMAAIQLGALLGALLGGALGELTSPRVTIFFGAFGELLAVLWLLPLLRSARSSPGT